MEWGCFSSPGVGPIHLITGIVTADIYINMHEELILPYAEDNVPLHSGPGVSKTPQNKLLYWGNFFKNVI